MMPRLYQPRRVEHLVEQVGTGTRALAEQVRRWRAGPPPARDLAGARRAVEGLSHMMAELAQQQEVGP